MSGGELLSVEAALALLLAGAVPLPAELVNLDAAANRVTAAPLEALLTQPPFDASAMDGYAARAGDVTTVPCDLRLIAEAAAGHPFEGFVGAGEAVRIFTGAAVPNGADAVVIQEVVTRDGARITVRDHVSTGDNIRAKGGDFRSGDPLIATGRRLTPRDLLVAAGSGHAKLAVHRRPRVAILATGDELVPSGTIPGSGQIVSSIPLGLSAMVAVAGGLPIQLGIARDDLADLDSRIAAAGDADILVTIGSASVGDHDLIGKALQARGLDLAFWKIAMRPGKPLLVGRLGAQRVLGLPGNPVSAMMCAHVFLVPLIRALSGLAPSARATVQAVAAEPIPDNGPRQHYIRVRLERRTDTAHGPPLPPLARPVSSQDSSLVRLLAAADGLLIRPPNARALPAGAAVAIELLDE